MRKPSALVVALTLPGLFLVTAIVIVIAIAMLMEPK